MNVVLMQQDAVDINDRLIKTIQHAFEKFLSDKTQKSMDYTCIGCFSCAYIAIQHCDIRIV